jgi:tRNA threonylcarbamoyl adenosine modification protein (Sua5/YciO/YrdC/YwlC family)
LTASKEVPRRLQHPKRKTIGLRIPDNAIVQALLAELHEPLMSVTLILPGHEEPVSDPEEVYEQIHKHVDLIVSGGACGIEPTTVIDCVSGVPQLIRAGKGQFPL